MAHFKHLDTFELTEEDFAALDGARKNSYFVISVDTFAQQIIAEEYDIWRLEGLEDCHYIIATTFLTGPDYKLLQVNYSGGHNVLMHAVSIADAVFEIADNYRCDKVLFYMVNNMASFFPARKIASLYELERPEKSEEEPIFIEMAPEEANAFLEEEDPDGQPEDRREHVED